MNIIGKRKLWYAISLLLVIPGIISLFMNGLKLGIDFNGGSLLELEGATDTVKVRQLAVDRGFKDITVTPTDQNRLMLRYRDPAPIEQHEANHQVLKEQLTANGMNEVRFDAVGPSVSRDITRNAILSILLASLAIVLYIAYAFRNAPPPVSPWSFGCCAIVALLHDALLLIGVFSILGQVADVEVDALFVTAVLTVIGFSVHDTIVVFDRIRENLRRRKGSLSEVVNASILETFARSLNTSVTVLITLLALYLFGGESIRLFVLALLLGIASGTYSSIFNASPMLVDWHEFKKRRAQKAKA